MSRLLQNRFGQSITSVFTVTDTPQTVHAIVKLSANQNLNYIWTVLQDDLGAFSIDTDNADGILLQKGFRFKVESEVAQSHPLSFLDQEDIYLAQGNQNEFYFTVDKNFAESVVAYECDLHPQMTGAVSFF